MELRIGAQRRFPGVQGRIAVLFMISCIGWPSGVAGQTSDEASPPPWPCRLYGLPDTVEDGWKRSATFRQKCDELARTKAVVLLQWGSMDSQSQALTRMDVSKTGVLARVTVPPVSNAVALIAHELQHVLEKSRGLDFKAEAKRPGSGVWLAFGGFETQAAVDVGARVMKELLESSGASRRR
jgi:hypothetical protein